MSRAFCVQESYMRDKNTGAAIPRDLSSAAEFGSVEFLLSQDEKGSLTPAFVMDKLLTKLSDFDPESDYLFTSGGDPLNFPLAVAALKELGVDKFKYLRWERSRNNASGGFYVATDVRLY